MGKLTFRILLFLLPLLLVIPILEISLRRIPNDYKLKKEYLDHHAGEIETLVLGNSHTYYGVDPAYFEGRCFNAGIYGQTLRYDYEILKKYEQHWDRLSIVVVPISYHSLYAILETSPSKFRVTDYNLYYDLDVAASIKDYFELMGKQFSINVKQLMHYYIRGLNPITCTDLGWGTIHASADNQELLLSGETAAKRHVAAVKNAAEGDLEKNLESLAAMIGLCRKLDVHLLFVTTPAYDTYNDRLNKDYLGQTIAIMEDLVAPHEHCTYLNLLEDKAFLASEFYDADHVNELGAEKLSLLLFRFTEKLGVKMESQATQQYQQYQP